MYKSGDILLTPFIEEHVTDEYLGWLNNPETCKFTSHCRWPMTKQRAVEYINSVNRPESGTIVWAIKQHVINSERTDDEPYTHIGNVCLTQIDMLNRSAEFAIIIGDKNSWGHSVGARVMGMVLGHGFTRLNLNRIWLGTAESNIGMQKAAVKSGMRREGIFKGALFINGKFEDDYIYSINRNKYFRLIKAMDEATDV